jgi:branched-chain amino acid transport system ATP-binding protein
MALLDVSNLTIKFGGLVAVSDFNVQIEKRELIGLIGPNGAGKTTVFNMLTGVYLPTEGDIKVEGKSIVGMKPYEITKKSLARTFQNIRLFKSMSVIDNVKLSYNFQIKYNYFDAVVRTPKYFKQEQEIERRAIELLKVFKLEGKADELAMNLPYGEQRRLEIARAMAANPKLLLLDEPAAGMNPQETHDLMNLIRWIRDHFDLTILLIEHDMKLVMGICERLVVLDYGKIIATGTPDQIKNNPKVIEAYLGEESSNEC